MIYDTIAGGPELLAWFGEVPTFHDAEIISLSLTRQGRSELKIHGWIMTDKADPDGYIVLDKHAVVTFSLEDVMDLQLDSFSPQNVINALVLGRARERGRGAYHAIPAEPDDIEIELLPCYGLNGFIRAKKVEISFTPDPPSEKT